MSADKLYVNDLIVEVDVNDQSVVVASDVEHNVIIAEETRVPVGVLDSLRTPPSGFRRLRVPSPQRLFSSLVSLPEDSKGSASDYTRIGVRYHVPVLGTIPARGTQVLDERDARVRKLVPLSTGIESHPLGDAN